MSHYTVEFNEEFIEKHWKEADGGKPPEIVESFIRTLQGMGWNHESALSGNSLVYRFWYGPEDLHARVLESYTQIFSGWRGLPYKLLGMLSEEFSKDVNKAAYTRLTADLSQELDSLMDTQLKTIESVPGVSIRKDNPLLFRPSEATMF